MIKYCCDIALEDTALATQIMQEWMCSPIGASAGILGIFGLTSLSLLTTHTKKDEEDEDEDEHFFKQWVISSWPYARSIMKALLNAQRGVTTTLNLAYLLNINDVRHLIIPIGLLIGILSAFSRACAQYKTNYHKKILKENTDLLTELKDLTQLLPAQIEKMRGQIHQQSPLFKTLCYLSALSNGLIDGLNPYLGALALASISPQIVVVLTIFYALYFLTTLTTRIHNEIMSQNKLSTTQKELELTLLEKEIDMLITTLSALNEQLTRTPKNNLIDNYKIFSEHLNHKRLEQGKIIQQLSLLRSEASPLISGLKNGLHAYKYLMLSINTCLFLSQIKISSFSAINRAIVGLTALGGGVTYSLTASFQKQTTAKSAHNPTKDTIDYQLKNSHLFFSSPTKKRKQMESSHFSTFDTDDLLRSKRCTL